MILLAKKYNASLKALDALKKDIELIGSKEKDIQRFYKHFRNSQIKSFEFSIDTFWKFLKEYLAEVYKLNLQIASPKAIFKEAFGVRLISEKETAALSEIIEARNLTSHTYNEPLAEEISDKIPAFYQVIKSIMDRIEIQQ